METIDRWQDFARVTIQTNDLDPMYEMLYLARDHFGDEWVKRYCMHFLMFYHAGEAVEAANDDWQWEQYFKAYSHLRRGTERRHFRGAQGYNALKRLAATARSPAEAFAGMVAPTYSQLVQLFLRGHYTGCGFGDYFTWKVLDLQTRVFDHTITLTTEEAVKHLPTDPQRAAIALWPTQHPSHTLDMIVTEIKQYHIPFRVGNCGLQEAETVLCMLKGAYITKKHKIGDDIDDKYKALADHPTLQALLPDRVEPDKYVLGELREMATT